MQIESEKTEHSSVINKKKRKQNNDDDDITEDVNATSVSVKDMMNIKKDAVFIETQRSQVANNTKGIVKDAANGTPILGTFKRLSTIGICLVALITFSALIDGSAAFKKHEKKSFKVIKFSEFDKNVTYSTYPEYNPRGMAPLYNLTHMFFDAILSDDPPIPPGYLVIEDNEILFGPKVERNEWGDLLAKYWLILLIVVLLVVIIMTMPIIALCFCCCRCAGACGSRSEPFDKKHDTCRRVFLGFLLILLSTGILFGVIIAFANNTYMEEGFRDSSTTIRKGSNDINSFLKITAEHYDHVLVANYKQLSELLKAQLQDTPLYVISYLEEQSKADALDTILDFTENELPSIKSKLEALRNATNDLRIYASQLTDGLRAIKRDLTYNEIKLKYDISTFDNRFHYDKIADRYFPEIPDFRGMIDDVDKLIKGDYLASIKRGKQSFDELSDNIAVSIRELTPPINAAIDKAGAALQSQSNMIKAQIKNVTNLIKHHTDSSTESIDYVYAEFGPYRNYFNIAGCTILLIILLCLIAALMCGICGKRPGGYGDDCCNKGAGASFLMLAIALIFLTFSIISLIGLVYFLAGMISYRGACVPMSNPEHDELFSELERLFDLNTLLYPTTGKTVTGNLPAFRISHAITACQANQTIYEVLHMENRYNIRDIHFDSRLDAINKTLDELVERIDQPLKSLKIFANEDKAMIVSMGDSKLNNFSFEIYDQYFEEDKDLVSLSEIAKELESLAPKKKGNHATFLRNSALHLKTYEEKLVRPFEECKETIQRISKELEHDLSYKNNSYKNSIELLVEEVEESQRFMIDKGQTFIKSVMRNLTGDFSQEIANYLNLLINSVEKKIGLCAPLARVYDVGVEAVCKRVVDPMNGFWLGVFVCALLFLPTLCIGNKLACLYKKSDPYPGPLVEAGPKNKRRKSKERSGRGVGRGREYQYEDYADDLPPQVATASSTAAGVRDTRYNDMAPKHWDGGPPRYQNPPMAPPASEYERPPPYYYPGASDQD